MSDQISNVNEMDEKLHLRKRKGEINKTIKGGTLLRQQNQRKTLPENYRNNYNNLYAILQLYTYLVI